MALSAVALTALGFVPALAVQDPVRLTPASAPLTTITLPMAAARGGRVTDAQRLIDGRVLVVRASPATVQLYQADGTLQRELFRAPPTERFKGRANLLGSFAAGINIADDGDGTITRYTSTATLIRTESLKEADYIVRFLLHRGTLLYDLTPASIPCVRQAVGALPAPATAVAREARFDPAGRMWWRASGTDEWTVGDVTGRAIARVVLPPRFLLYQIGDGYVVGKTTGADSERVQVLSLQFPGPPPAPPACRQGSDQMRPEREGTAGMRLMLSVAAQRMVQARTESGAYPTSAEVVMPTSQRASGTSFRILRADAVGFLLLAETVDGKLRCLTARGDIYPSLPEEYVLCGT